MSLLLFTAFVPYLAPTGVAAYRDHASKNAIFLINLFLGWTLIGWIAAMIWACVGTSNAHHVAAAGDEYAPGGLKLQGRDPRFDR